MYRFYLFNVSWSAPGSGLSFTAVNYDSFTAYRSPMKTVILLVFVSFAAFGFEAVAQSYTYTPDGRKLHDTIAVLDSMFFDAYSNCEHKLEEYASFYSESLEFYHDKSGLSNSKKEMVEATQRNICGKVKRELIKGSIEVYPIKGYGAIEMGLHKFINSADYSHLPEPSRFIIFWQNKNGEWKIAKVVSLH